MRAFISVILILISLGNYLLAQESTKTLTFDLGDLAKEPDSTKALSDEAKNYTCHITSGELSYYPIEKLEALIDKTAEIGFNRIFFRMDNSGQSILMKSRFIRKSSGDPINLYHNAFYNTVKYYDGNQAEDLIQTVIDRCHEDGIEVYAWFTPFDQKGDKYIKDSCPDWWLVSKDTNNPETFLVLNYCNENVRNYQLQVLDTLFYRYPEIDGVFYSNRSHTNQGGEQTTIDENGVYNYGWNQVTLNYYDSLFGEKPDTNNFNQYKFSAALGKGYTDFIKESSEKIKEYNKKFTVAVSFYKNSTYPQYKISNRLGGFRNIFFQYQNWVSKGYIDELIIGGDEATSTEKEHITGYNYLEGSADKDLYPDDIEYSRWFTTWPQGSACSDTSLQNNDDATLLITQQSWKKYKDSVFEKLIWNMLLNDNYSYVAHEVMSLIYSDQLDLFKELNNLYNWASFGGVGSGGHYLVGDFDGNGKDDLLVHYKYPDSDSAWHNIVALSDGSYFYTQPDDWASFGWVGNNGHYLVGDFDGNGMDDLLVHYKDSNSVWHNTVALSNGSKFITKSKDWAKFGGVGSGGHYLVGDFDGNGMDDLLVHYKDSNDDWHNIVALSDGSYFYTQSDEWAAFGGVGTNGHYLVGDFGDFDEDDPGRDDLLVHYKDSDGVWHNIVALSGGDYFYSQEDEWAAFGGVGSGGHYLVGDYDGNGKDDLLVHYKNPNSDSTWHNIVALSDGSYFYTQEDEWAAFGGVGSNGHYLVGDFGDFDEDDSGRDDLLVHYKDPKDNWHNYVSVSNDSYFVLRPKNYFIHAEEDELKSTDNEVITNIEQSDDLSIYPNPTSQYFFINSKTKIYSISLYSLSGKLLYIKNIDELNCTINTDNLNSGLYFLKCNLGNKIVSKKLMIKH